jgi:hypothetical protein
MYGDVYLYHDTHLHPAKIFPLTFVCINLYIQRTCIQAILILSHHHTPYSMIQSTYYSILGGTIYMIPSCSYDIISSTF